MHKLNLKSFLLVSIYSVLTVNVNCIAKLLYHRNTEEKMDLLALAFGKHAGENQIDYNVVHS